MTEIRRSAEPAPENEPNPPEEEAPELSETVRAQEAPEIAATANIAEIAKEDQAVIDVHAAHGGIHTWKDFWIHLGTITLGLLIAISLEQTVEYFHHLHQRHELEQQFTAEGEANKEIAEKNFARLDDRMEWLLGLQQDIETMRATGGKANLPYREREGPGYINLATAVWDGSKGTERFGLLPDELADGYTRTYKQAEWWRDAITELGIAANNRAAFEMKFADSSTPLTPVLSRMSPAELTEYEGLVTAQFTAMRQVKTVLKSFYGDDIATLKGLRGVGAQVAEQEAARKQFPDDFKKMTAEIEAERAKGAK
jgi:hypothetical protein